RLPEEPKTSRSSLPPASRKASASSVRANCRSEAAATKAWAVADLRGSRQRSPARTADSRRTSSPGPRYILQNITSLVGEKGFLASEGPPLAQCASHHCSLRG